MRIAVVTETWSPAVNGVVTRLRHSVPELVARGHEVLVLTPRPFADPLPGARLEAVASVSIPFIYGGHPWGLPLPRAFGLIEEFRPDVVHAVSPVLLGWAAVLVAERRSVPLVCSYHTHVAEYARFYGLRAAEEPIWAVVRRLHAAADVNMAASPAAGAELAAHGVRLDLVWPGAVAESFSTALPSLSVRRVLSGRSFGSRPLALFVGRLAAEKQIERLRPLAEAGWSLALIGDGPHEDTLRLTFAGLPVRFLGRRDADFVARAMASSDLFVFPSTTDTLGLVLLEAVAAGVPVAAAASPASSNLLEGLPAARLFEAGDGGSLMAAAGAATAHGLSRAALQAAARDRVLSWQAATDVVEAAYELAVRRRRARRAAA